MSKKVSDEDPAGTLDGTEEIYVVQDGGSARTTTQAIANLAPGGGSGSVIVDARLTFAAVVDGSSAGGTDNETVMATGLATLHNGVPYSNVFIQDNLGLDVSVSVKTPNPYGVRIGPGRLIQTGNFPSDPGRVQLNSDADWRGHTCGQEYLYAFQNKLQLRTGCIARFCGDSTTAGDSLVHTVNTIDLLTQQVVADHGYAMAVQNAGHSGITDEQWRTTYLAGDLTAAPDLMVIRYVVNSPGWKKDGTSGTLNEYESEYALRRDIGDFFTTMHAALTTIRATVTGGLTQDVTNLSIILMNGNSTADSPNGRDEKWYELTGAVLRQLARDFNCAFIDSYAIWRDSRNAAGRWMDDAALPSVDGRAIHPLDIMNQWIASVIGDMIVPSGMELRNQLAARVAPLTTNLPSQFAIGESTFAVSWTINGVVVVGILMVSRNADGTVNQRVASGAGYGAVSERFGSVSSNTWFDWISTPTNTAGLALQNGWTDSSGSKITFGKTNGIVTVRGRITGGTVAGGTLLFTLPTGFVPVFDEYRAVRCGSSLSSDATIVCSHTNAGQVLISNCPSNALFDIAFSFSTI